MAPLPPIEIQKAFQPPLFVNTNAIYQMHNDLPRAGYTNDVRVLFNGPKDQSREYIIGYVGLLIYLILPCSCICVSLTMVVLRRL
jgi:hypothetical protein